MQENLAYWRVRLLNFNQRILLAIAIDRLTYILPYWADVRDILGHLLKYILGFHVFNAIGHNILHKKLSNTEICHIPPDWIEYLLVKKT